MAGTAARVGPSDALDLLRSVRTLSGIDEPLLRRLAATVRVVSVGAGQWLFRADDEADTAYVLASGRLEVLASGASEKVLGVLRRGAVIGELALLQGGKRTASVRACRDSSLISIDRQQFEALLRDAPAFALGLTRALAGQLAAATGSASSAHPKRTIAVVALDDDIDASEPAATLADELSRHGTAMRITSLPGNDPQEWPAQLGRAEDEHQRVVLATRRPDPTDAWTSLCVQEADLIVAVTAGNPAPAWMARASTLAGCELVVVGGEPGALLDGVAPALVRVAADGARLRELMAQLARRIAGRAVGLVLSGGGARAFAHLGVIEELRRNGVRIDCVGGVSLGSIVAALVARGDSDEEMYRRIAHYFVHEKPTNDYTLPLVSLLRGRKTERLLAEAFAGDRIESLKLPFYCTSTDLRDRTMVVHRTGPVAEALLASLSIPGVFPPRPDRDGRLLVDGGVLDNLPARVLIDAAEGPVIAVDVSGGPDAVRAETNGGRLTAARVALRRTLRRSEMRVPRLPETMMLCLTLASGDTVAAARRQADLVIAPDVSGTGLLDWRRLPQMRQAGIAAAQRALREHADVISRLCD